MGIIDGFMQSIGFEKKALEELPPTPSGGMIVQELRDSILKAIQPKYLYKPPFGYPRPINTTSLRELAKNPYVFSVVKTLADEAAATEWDIVDKDDDTKPEAEEGVRERIIEFLKNPNANDESFSYLVKEAVTDILEVDAGVWVKVFNQAGELCQLYSRDGASFLKNPDIYGTMTHRVEFVAPLPGAFETANKNYFDSEHNDNYMNLTSVESLNKRYNIFFTQKAAYFQYGQAFAAWPIPFGTREVVYMSANPRADSIYGRSPLEILADIILTLVYGSKYNLDFYLNNNMPEGIISLEGANQDDVNALAARMSAAVRDAVDSMGFSRRMGYRIPVTNTPIDFKPFQLTPGDMQILEQQKWFDRIMIRCFGMNEAEMGTTDNANKATSVTQGEVFKRKALKPILNLLAYHINTQILPEFKGSESLEFKWNHYDIDEDIKKHTIYEAQLRMGVKTAEMIAKELGVDVEQLKRDKAEKLAQQPTPEEGTLPPRGTGFEKGNARQGEERTGTPLTEEERKERHKEKEKKEIEKKAASNPEMNEIKEYISDFGKMLVEAFEEENLFDSIAEGKQ